MRITLITILLSVCAGCAIRDADTVDLSSETELLAVDFEVVGIEDLDFRLARDFSADWYSGIYFEALELRLPEESMNKLSEGDRENLQKRFTNAKQTVFEEGELSAEPGPARQRS